MAARARIVYCSGMAEALDPARLSSLPEDLRATFEAQAKALAEKTFELDIERTARRRLEAEKSQLAAKKSDLEAENAFLKEANARLEHLVREFRRARFGPDRRSSTQTNSSWHSRTSRSPSQKSGNPSLAEPGLLVRPMPNARSAAPALCPRSCRASSG